MLVLTNPRWLSPLLFVVSHLLVPCAATTCTFPNSTALPSSPHDFLFLSETFDCVKAVKLDVNNTLQHIDAVKAQLQEHYVFMDIAKNAIANLSATLELGDPSYSIYNGSDGGQVDAWAELEALSASVKAADQATLGTVRYTMLEIINRIRDEHISPFGGEDDHWFGNRGGEGVMALWDFEQLQQPTFTMRAGVDGEFQMTATFSNGTDRTLGTINGLSPMQWIEEVCRCHAIPFNYKALGPRVTKFLSFFKAVGDDPVQSPIWYTYMEVVGDLTKCFADSIPVTYTDGTDATWHAVTITNPTWYKTGDPVETAGDIPPTDLYQQTEVFRSGVDFVPPPGSSSPVHHAFKPFGKQRPVQAQSTRSGPTVPFPTTCAVKNAKGDCAVKYTMFEGVAFLKINDFQLNVLSEVVDGWLGLIKAAQEAGVDRLVVDVSGNPGGNVGAGLQMAALMYPDIEYKDLRRRCDSRVGPAWLYYIDQVYERVEDIRYLMLEGYRNTPWSTLLQEITDGLNSKGPESLLAQLRYAHNLLGALKALCLAQKQSGEEKFAQSLMDKQLALQAIINSVSTRNITAEEVQYILDSTLEIRADHFPGDRLRSPSVYAGVYDITTPPERSLEVRARGGGQPEYFTSPFYWPTPSQVFEGALYAGRQLGTKHPVRLPDSPFRSYTVVGNGDAGSTTDTFISTIRDYVKNTPKRVTPLTFVSHTCNGKANDCPLAQYIGGSVSQATQSQYYSTWAVLLITNVILPPDLRYNGRDGKAIAERYGQLIPPVPYWATQLPKLTTIEIFNNVVNFGPDAVGYPTEYVRMPPHIYLRQWYVSARKFDSPELPELYREVIKVIPDFISSYSTEERRAYMSAKYGLPSVGHSTIGQLSAAQRQALASKITRTETLDLGDSVALFTPAASGAIAMSVPGSSLTFNIGSTWGPGVTRGVATSYPANSSGFAAAGINDTAAADGLFLFVVDRLDDAGNVISNATFCFSLTPNTTFLGLVIHSYASGSSVPVDITTEAGNITLDNGTYTICASHTSTFTGTTTTTTPTATPTPISDSTTAATQSAEDSDGALWGLMALLVIPLAAIGALIFYCLPEKETAAVADPVPPLPPLYNPAFYNPAPPAPLHYNPTYMTSTPFNSS